MSPYLYAANNPIYYEDQDGEGPIPFRFKKYLKRDSFYVTGLIAGIGDGILESLDSVAGVVQTTNAFNPVSPYFWTKSAKKVRKETLELSQLAIKIFSDEELRDKMYSNIKKELGNWYDEFTLQGTAAEAGYQHGKMLFDVLTAIVGVSEIKYLLKTGEFTLSGSKLLKVWKKAKLLKPTKIKGWKVGQSIRNLTKKGNIPSWDAVRQRYWKNVAYYAEEGVYSERDMKRMKKGLARQVWNKEKSVWESIELHHDPPQREGGLFNFIEVTPSEHAKIDKYRKLKNSNNGG